MTLLGMDSVTVLIALSGRHVDWMLAHGLIETARYQANPPAQRSAHG